MVMIVMMVIYILWWSVCLCVTKMITFPSWAERRRRQARRPLGRLWPSYHNDGDDGEEKEGLHDFAECETKTSAQSLGKRDVTEGRWDIHGTQIWKLTQKRKSFRVICDLWENLWRILHCSFAKNDLTNTEKAERDALRFLPNSNPLILLWPGTKASHCWGFWGWWTVFVGGSWWSMDSQKVKRTRP